MSIIDNAVKANRQYAQKHDRRLAQRPYPTIAVVTCMDPRLSDLPAILGIPQADIDVIRTGRQLRKTYSESSLSPPASSDRRRSCCSITPAAAFRHSPMPS